MHWYVRRRLSNDYFCTKADSKDYFKKRAPTVLVMSFIVRSFYHNNSILELLRQDYKLTQKIQKEKKS